MRANSFIEAYWVGLANEVRPTLEQIIAWMETQPEPDQAVFSEEHNNWYDKWYVRYTWWQVLGLCKWLSRGDSADKELRAALDIEKQAWRNAKPDDLLRDHKVRKKS